MTVRVAIRDVAKHAGVSRATISNYLNQRELVSEPTQAKIAASIDVLGFVPSEAARQLGGRINTTIGYVAFEVDNEYFAFVANAIERRAQELGWNVLIANTRGSIEREEQYLESFERQRVGGVIVAPAGNVEDRLEGMRARGTRSVLAGRAALSPDQPSVSVDDSRGGYLAAKHLIDTGRRKLAFVGGPFELPQVNERFLGALKAVKDCPAATIEVIACDERTIRGGRAVGLSILARVPARRPDAVFGVNDPVALGVMQMLLHESVSVPDDIAVIGYDDFDIDEIAAVSLSSISTPHDAIGAAAVDLVLGHTPAAGQFVVVDQRYIFEPNLVSRESTRPARDRALQHGNQPNNTTGKDREK